MLAECSDELIRCLIPIERQYPRITRIVLKHPVLTALSQQDGLHGDGRQIWHDDIEFLWDGLGIRDVRHNEAPDAPAPSRARTAAWPTPSARCTVRSFSNRRAE